MARQRGRPAPVEQHAADRATGGHGGIPARGIHGLCHVGRAAGKT